MQHSPHLRGAGEKAFCAGGDIRAITAVPGGEMQRQFFSEEYQLDHLVSYYHKFLIFTVLLGGKLFPPLHCPLKRDHNGRRGGRLCQWQVEDRN